MTTATNCSEHGARRGSSAARVPSMASRRWPAFRTSPSARVRAGRQEPGALAVSATSCSGRIGRRPFDAISRRRSRGARSRSSRTATAARASTRTSSIAASRHHRRDGRRPPLRNDARVRRLRVAMFAPVPPNVAWDVRHRFRRHAKWVPKREGGKVAASATAARSPSRQKGGIVARFGRAELQLTRARAGCSSTRHHPVHAGGGPSDGMRRRERRSAMKVCRRRRHAPRLSRWRARRNGRDRDGGKRSCSTRSTEQFTAIDGGRMAQAREVAARQFQATAARASRRAATRRRRWR